MQIIIFPLQINQMLSYKKLWKKKTKQINKNKRNKHRLDELLSDRNEMNEWDGGRGEGKWK